eukprot:GCRY01002241.1.p1 GENE.GCRY01002241.1~~GCRY01002241.1.p1  ORF type:complete len:289 (-),score=0.24 GCRY01002241.1:243-1109(-)
MTLESNFPVKEVLFHVQTSHYSRFFFFLDSHPLVESVVKVTRGNTRKTRTHFLVAETEEPFELLQEVFKSHGKIRALRACYFTSRKTTDFSELLEPNQYKGQTLRLHCFPKSLSEELKEKLPLAVDLHHRNFTHILSVVHNEHTEEFNWAVVPKELYFPVSSESTNAEGASCKAYYKIEEALLLSKSLVDPSWKGLDIGAAPGGWTGYLAKTINYVAAVDPGDLDPLVKALPNVCHFQARIEDCLIELKEKGLYDVIVCDINAGVQQSAKIILSALSCLKPDAVCHCV